MAIAVDADASAAVADAAAANAAPVATAPQQRRHGPAARAGVRLHRRLRKAAAAPDATGVVGLLGSDRAGTWYYTPSQW